MNKINNGGWAFPSAISEQYHAYEDGMTLRDYFAAKTIQGIIEAWSKNHGGTYPNSSKEFEEISECCYGLSDAMLKAREIK